jgi:hypothetical protein
MFFGLNDVAFLGSLQPPALWTPADITTALWLDAADVGTVTESGGLVSQWGDKSGNGFNLAQAASTSRPAYVSNQLDGKPIIRNVSQNFLERSNVPILKDVAQGWIVAVVKYPAGGVPGGNNGPVIYASVGTSTGTRGTRMSLIQSAQANTSNIGLGARRLDSDSFATLATSTPRSAVEGFWAIIIGNVDYQAAQANHWTNGSQDITSQSILTAGNSSNTNAQTVRIFTAVFGSVSDNTELAEALILEGSVSPADRQRIEGYLAHKWGLTANLPNDHPYKTAAPTV